MDPCNMCFKFQERRHREHREHRGQREGGSGSDDATGTDGGKKTEAERSSDNPFPRVTQSRTDSHVDVASTLYGKASYTSHGYVKYTVSDVLGKGHYGMVFLAVNETSGKTYAVKVMKKKVRNINKYAYIEEAVLRLSRHCSFIVHLYSSFQTKHSYYLVMEYAKGGNLKQLLDTYGCLSIDCTRFMAAEMVLGLDFLHINGVIHRDLKIQNILLTSDRHIRLIDFGLSKMGILGDETTNSGCGTPFYMAPEILRRVTYGNEVDWWALGVVVYKMVTGAFPFMGKTNPEVFVAVTRDRPYYDPHLPSDLISFIKGLLQKHPAKRLGFGKDGVHQVKSHLFFEVIDWASIERQEKQPPPFESSPETSQQPSGFVKKSSRSKVRVTKRLSGSVPDVKEVLELSAEPLKRAVSKQAGMSKSTQSWSPVGLKPDVDAEGANSKATVHLTVVQSSNPGLAEKERREKELNEHYPFLPTEPATSPRGTPKEFVLDNSTV